MPDAYTIRIFVPDGNPEGVKVVDLLNWTGVGVAFPRSEWPSIKGRPEFTRSGVYILSGSEEGVDDELPTIYVGQGDEVGKRLDQHYKDKDFWDWGYAFVSRSNALNRAHITWLEYALIQQGKDANRCHFDNKNAPRDPKLSESDAADTNGFLHEILRILPIVGVHVFEKPVAVAVTEPRAPGASQSTSGPKPRDTIVVPAQKDGFDKVFIGENCWYAIRIGGGMLSKIKYIAAYQAAPVSAVTHFAPVASIEPYGDKGKYRVLFAEPALRLSNPVPFGDADKGSMQSCRYTNFNKLQAAKSIADLFG